MKTEKQAQDNGHVKITVSITQLEVENAFNEGLQFYARQMRIDSVEGSTPEDKIRNAFEDRADEVIINAVTDYLLPFVLAEAKEIPVVTPQITFDEPPVKDRAFTMVVDVYPKPQVELSSYEPIEAVIDSTEVTEEDIDEQISMLIESYNAQADAAQPGIVLPDGTQSKAAPMTASDLTDEWVAENFPEPNINTIAELRERVRQASAEYKLNMAEGQTLEQSLDAITKRLVEEVPADMIQETAVDMLTNSKCSWHSKECHLIRI